MVLAEEIEVSHLCYKKEDEKINLHTSSLRKKIGGGVQMSVQFGE